MGGTLGGEKSPPSKRQKWDVVGVAGPEGVRSGRQEVNQRAEGGGLRGPTGHREILDSK